MMIKNDRQEVKIISYIATSHKLAKELLQRPDKFLTVTIGDEEYVVDNIQCIHTHANRDDSVTHWTLNVRSGGKGNIKR